MFQLIFRPWVVQCEQLQRALQVLAACSVIIVSEGDGRAGSLKNNTLMASSFQ